MRSKKPHRFSSNASDVGLVFGEEHRWRAWRNIGLDGNLLLPFIFHFQPRVMDCLSLIFFQGLLRWLFFFFFLCYSIILVIWGITTISNDEIGRILFSPKRNWNSQNCYDVFAYSQSVGILELLIMDFSHYL